MWLLGLGAETGMALSAQSRAGTRKYPLHGFGPERSGAAVTGLIISDWHDLIVTAVIFGPALLRLCLTPEIGRKGPMFLEVPSGTYRYFFGLFWCQAHGSVVHSVVV
jgi:hypothetical protein